MSKARLITIPFALVALFLLMAQGCGGDDDPCGEGATCDGFVAYVDRGGGILFEDKARSAIHAGAKAIIIGNNEAESAEGNFT